MQGRDVELALIRHHPSQSLDLTGERNPVRYLGEVERLNPQRVACDKERFGVRVPEREGKDPVETLKHPLAFRSVELEQDFGVGGAAERQTASLEILSELAEVVDLPVIYDDRSVLPVHR